MKVVKAKEELKKTQEVVRKAQEEKKRAKEMVMKMKESVREPGIHDCIKAVNDEVNAESAVKSTTCQPNIMNQEVEHLSW